MRHAHRAPGSTQKRCDESFQRTDALPLNGGMSGSGARSELTPNTFRMPALISPEQAATEILKGWAGGDFEIHFPRRFTLWMKALELLPYKLYFHCVRRFTG